MKNGSYKRLLAFILTVAMMVGNVVPAFADEHVGNGANDIVQTAEPEEDDTAAATDTAGADTGAGADTAEGSIEEQDEAAGNGESGNDDDTAAGEEGTASVSGPDTETVSGNEDDEDENTRDWSVFDDIPAGAQPLPDDLEIGVPDIYMTPSGRRRYNGDTYPSEYVTPDLPDLRDQGDYGTCWAHSAMALAEINLLKKGITVDSEDLSELQLAYFTYNKAADLTDPLGGTAGDINDRGTDKSKKLLDNGGNACVGGFTLSNWIGAADEKTVPYTKADTVENKWEQDQKGLEDEYAYGHDRAHLTDMYVGTMPCPDNDFKSDLYDGVKKLVYEHGAASILFYADSKYYLEKNNSYYVPDDKVGNHVVTIVGWDDDFSKDNFKTEPEGDGAWLIRNSWTTGGFDNHQEYDGYFWLSYYDRSFDTSVVSYEYDLEDNFDNNYLYDGGMNTVSSGYSTGASVFKASSDETLKAVSFATWDANVNYNISVYRGLSDGNDPQSGTPCATASGNIIYPGYYTVDLDEGVSLSTNEIFSVVVSLEGVDGTERQIAREGTQKNSSWYSTKAVAEEGQSFVWYDDEWKDMEDLSDANLRIRAFTDNGNEGVSVESISFNSLSDNTLKLYVGGTKQVTPETTPDTVSAEKLSWTSSKPEVATVSRTGVVRGIKEGECTVTASYGDGVSGNFIVSVTDALQDIAIVGNQHIKASADPYQYSIKTVPTGKDPGVVEWSSSDPTVLSIDEATGAAVAHKAGKATISVNACGITKSLEVTVDLYGPEAEIIASRDNAVTISWPAIYGAQSYQINCSSSPTAFGTDTVLGSFEADGRESYTYTDHSHEDSQGEYYYLVGAVGGPADNRHAYYNDPLYVNLNESYDITYVLNGAQNDPDNPAYYRKGERVELNDPIPDPNYNIASWYSDKKLTIPKSTISENETGAQTFYARNEEPKMPYAMTIKSSDEVADSGAFSFDEARSYIDRMADSVSEDATWNIKLNSDIKTSDSLLFDDKAPKVHIDLNGKTVTLTYGSEVECAEISNGTIAHTKKVSLLTDNTDIAVKGVTFNTPLISIQGNNTVSIDTLNTSSNIEVAGSLSVNRLTMKGGCLENEGFVKADEITSILRVDNKYVYYKTVGFEVGKMTMDPKGVLCLEPGTCFHVKDEAHIYSLMLGQDMTGQEVSASGKKALLTRSKDATLIIDTKVQAKDAVKDRLAVGTVSADQWFDSSWSESDVIETPKMTELFTTNIKSFPSDLITVAQPAGVSYNTVMQIDNKILVGKDWITICAGNDETPIGSFTKWSDAMTYLNTICQTGMEYTIVLSDDIQTKENISFPSKAKSITVSGNNEGAPVEFAFLGNTTLATNTIFKNLILVPQAYNKSTGRYDDNNASTINLNGKRFEWKNTYSKNKFGSVTGSGASTFVFDSEGKIEAGGYKMTLIVTNAINIPNLSVSSYAIKSDKNALTVANDAYLKSAEIDVATNVTIRNLHSLDAYNTFSYASAANNSFNIGGIVDSKDEEGRETGKAGTVSVNGISDNRVDCDVNENAVSLRVKYIENALIVDEKKKADGNYYAVLQENPAGSGKYTGKAYGLDAYVMTSYKYNAKKANIITGVDVDYTTKNLVTSAKGVPAYFLINKEVSDAGATASYVTKKVGNAIRVETPETAEYGFAVTLYRGGDIIGSYATLQEALTDIDRYADKTQNYSVELDKSKENTITPSVNRANLTMPKQAKKVTITTKWLEGSSVPADYTTLYMNNTLTLNTDLVFDRVKIADHQTTNNKGVTTNNLLNINLGAYALTFDEVTVSDVRIGNVAGNGTGKTSQLWVKSGDTTGMLTVNGTVNNVGEVNLQNTVLKAIKAVNIGNLNSLSSNAVSGSARLIGPVKSVTRDTKNKDEARRNDVTAVTPNITIAGEVNGENVSIGLLDTDGTYFNLKDTAKVPAQSPVLASGTPFATAIRVNSERVAYAAVSNDEQAKDISANKEKNIFKKNGNLVYMSSDYQAPYLLRYKAYDDDELYTLTYCMSFADAVTEINKLAVKRDYTIVIYQYESTDPDNAPDRTPDFVPDINNPAVVTMPQAKNINSLIIRGLDTGEGEVQDPMEAERKLEDKDISPSNAAFYYTGTTITMTCPTTFDGISMNRVTYDKTKNRYTHDNDPDPSEKDYLTATTLKTSGYDVIYQDIVVWDTPLVMDGGKKASLILGDTADVYTDIDMAAETIDDSDHGDNGAFINGSVTNFATISLGEKQDLMVRGFKTGKKTTILNGIQLYAETYVTPSLTATNINIDGGKIEVGDLVEDISTGTLDPTKTYEIVKPVYHPLDKTPASVTVTNMTVKGHDGNDYSTDYANETVTVHGKLTITNLTLKENEGENTQGVEDQTILAADREFNVGNKGTVVCGTGNAVLVSRRNSKGTPYLTIPGSVELQNTDDRIGVAVRKSIESFKALTDRDPDYRPDRDAIIEIVDLPDTRNTISRQLLTASSAKADVFAVVKDESLSETDDKKFLIKNGTSILVYDEGERVITVYSSEYEGVTTNVSADGVSCMCYPTWADAVKAIDAYNDAGKYYTIEINRPVGVASLDEFKPDPFPNPAALTMPSKAKGLYITRGVSDNYIYYTGSITLKCPTEFIGVDLNPVSVKSVTDKNTKVTTKTVNGANSAVTAGAYGLRLEDVTIGDAFDKLIPDDEFGYVQAKGNSACMLSGISSTNGEIALASEGLTVNGDVTSSKGNIMVEADTEVVKKVTAAGITINSGQMLKAGANGSTGVTATTLTLNGKATLSDNNANGKITITNLINNAEPSASANRIVFGRNAKGATNLEIKGAMSGDNNNQIILDMASGGTVNDYALTLEKGKGVVTYAETAKNSGIYLISNAKVNLQDTRKLFIAPKLTTDKIDMRIQGEADTSGANFVKGSNAFWYVRNEEAKENNTTKTTEIVQKENAKTGAIEKRTKIDTDAVSENDPVNIGLTTISGNMVTLKLIYSQKDAEPFTADYLDWSQAIAEINALNDPTATYEIDVPYGIYDTNMTDGNWRSALNMPANNKAAALTVIGSDSKTPVRFSGALTTYGRVEMQSIILNSQNNKGNAAADFNITMNPNSAKGQTSAPDPGFFLRDVTTMADYGTYWKYDGTTSANGTRVANQAGFIGKVSGSRTKTETMDLDDTNLRVKSGFANIGKLNLRGSNVISVAALTAENVTLTGYDVPSTLQLLAASTIGNIRATYADNKPYSYIATTGSDPKNAKGKPSLTITGTLTDIYPVFVRSIKTVNSDKTSNLIDYIGEEDQIGAKLVTAAKTDAAHFVIYRKDDQENGCFNQIPANGELITLGGGVKLVAYKDISNVVYNDKKDAFAVKLEREENATDYLNFNNVTSTSYAKTYAEAISMINAVADKDSAYAITFLKKGEEATKALAAEVNGEKYYSYSFGSFVWPKTNTTKYLTICGSEEEDLPEPFDGNVAELRYTGTLKPTTANLNVQLLSIILTEGTTKNVRTNVDDETGRKIAVNQTVFTPSYAITPDLTGADGVNIEFDYVKTLKSTPSTSKISPSGNLALPATEDCAVLGLAPGQSVSENTLVFSKVVSNTRYTGNKLTFCDNIVEGSGSRTDIWMKENSAIPSLESDYTVAIYTAKPLTINGDIYGNGTIDDISIHTAFSDYVAGKSFAGWGNTQLTINGNVFGKVDIHPYIDTNKDKNKKEYRAISMNELGGIEGTPTDNGAKPESGLDVGKIGSYQGYAKIANVKKGNASKFWVVAMNGNEYEVVDSNGDSGTLRVRKNNGALYVNSKDPRVRVTRYRRKDNYPYLSYVSESELDSWAMAVAEINNTADKNAEYEIELLDNDGGFGGYNNSSNYKYNPEKRDPGNVVFQLNNYNGEYGTEYGVSKHSFTDAPLSKIEMPTQAKHITICSQVDKPKALITTASKITFNCDTDMKDIAIIRVAAQKNQLYNYNVNGTYNYDLAVGNWKVICNDTVHELRCGISYHKEGGSGIEDVHPVSNIGNITGSKNGMMQFGHMRLPYYQADDEKKARLIQIGSVTGLGELRLDVDERDDDSWQNVLATGRLAPGEIYVIDEMNLHTKADINTGELFIREGGKVSSAKAMTATTLAVLGGGVFAGYTSGDQSPGGFDLNMPATADITAGEMVLWRSTAAGQNITVKSELDTEESGIYAGNGLTKPGQGGKVTVGNVNLISDNRINVKQDKNGKSQLTVKGTIDTIYRTPYGERITINDSVAHVGVRYNDDSGYAQIHDGIVLATAPKAEASWFRPLCEMMDEGTGKTLHNMGKWPEDYDVYKSGNTVCFGDVSGFEAKLITNTYYVNEDDETEEKYLDTEPSTGYTLFATFEEALKEIGSLNRKYQDPSDRKSYYEDYEIELLRDVDITNAKGAYIAPAMPTAVRELTIRSASPVSENGVPDPERLDPYTLAYSGALNIKSNTTMADMCLLDKGSKPGNLALGNYELRLIDVLGEFNEDPEEDESWFYGVEFGSITGGANGKITLDTIDKYGHDEDPYVIFASSVGGIKGIELWENTSLFVGGNCNANRIIYRTDVTDASGEDNGTAMYVGGNLTTQQIQMDPDKVMTSILYVNSTRTNKINGIQNKSTKQYVTFADPSDETTQINPEGALNVIVTNTDKVGSKVLTVKNLGAAGGTSMKVFKLYDDLSGLTMEDESVGIQPHTSYRVGENLMLGNRTA